jgi:hypothetical protein
MPIRDGDGTGIANIQEGDGKGIKEVREGDGTVLFSAGPDRPPSGLSRWTFDDADTSSGTAIDVWGSNDASISGATTGVSGANQTYTTNEAYSFDGTDDNVTPSDETVLDGLSEVSISVWFKTDTHDGNNRRMLSHISGSTFSDSTLLSYEGSSTRYQFDVINGGNFGNDRLRFPEADVTPGSWYHLVGVFDGPNDDMRFYLDATQKDSDSSIASSLPSPGGLAIGALDDNSDNYDGDLDDIRLYDKALTDTEVSNLYNTGSING